MPDFPPPLEPAPRRRARRVIAALVLLVLAGTAVAWWQLRRPVSADGSTVAPLDDAAARAPSGSRIRVRVVNTTATAGLARRATLALRDYGYDVVEFDTDRSRRSSTLVLVHTGHDDWGERLRRAMGTGSVETRPDSLRYLDLTVLIGSDWKAPTEPFRP